jgi:hypothetical protein
MKNKFKMIIGVLFIIALCPLLLSAYGASADSSRWDLMMIKEAPIWKNLLVDYSLADHQRFWPERKVALAKIIRDYPQSRWADDAALVLACGRASFENDYAGAIAGLMAVSAAYPLGQTIVVQWDKSLGCRFDENWLLWMGGLVFLNPDGSIRKANPFDRHGEMPQLEKEGLAYFAHLERCPFFTCVAAEFIKADMYKLQNKMALAISTLERIVSQSESYLPGFNRADRKAAASPDGYYIRKSLPRPEYRAYLDLAGLYVNQNKKDAAEKTLTALADKYSNDGWMWRVNDKAGDLFALMNLTAQAEKQYQLAVKGLAALKSDVMQRQKKVIGSDFPETYWQEKESEIKEKTARLSRQKAK